MTETLRKAIVHKSRLKIYIYIYISVKEIIKIWKILWSKDIFVLIFFVKLKQNTLKNLNLKDLSDNRNFWKTIKPYFSNKGLNSNKLLLKEKGNLVSDEKELVTITKTSLLISRKNWRKKVRVNSITWKVFLKHFNLNRVLKKSKSYQY